MRLGDFLGFSTTLPLQAELMDVQRASIASTAREVSSLWWREQDFSHQLESCSGLLVALA